MRFEALFIVYFTYGLAFFSLGLVLLLEYQRTPSRELRLLFLPLAVFGLLHGLHEWLEIFILQSQRLGGTLPDWIPAFRLGLLAFSFIALWIYGIQAFQVARSHYSPYTSFGLLTLPLYALLVVADVMVAYAGNQITASQMTDALVRYLLGVTGAAVASLGLHAGANRARSNGRRPLDRYLDWTAFGFALYSVTQLVVPQMDTLSARYINADTFGQATGIPIQVVRTFAAIIITWNLIRSTQFLERERQEELAAAQRERLVAIEQQEEMRRELLRHTVQAQEEERARVARELHDEMAQVLTALSLDLGTLERLTPVRSRTVPIIVHLQELGRQMSQRMHRMVYDLRPALLDDLGLVPALKYLAENDAMRLGLSIDFRVEGTSRRLDGLVETVLFRIAQESITNIARHARTAQACICLSYGDDEIFVQIADEGVGFSPGGDLSAPRRWGLAGMRERAESVGGQLRVESRPQGGTTVEARIPIRPI